MTKFGDGVKMEVNKHNFYLLRTLRELGTFLDALFPGRERSNVNFNPSPMKARSATTHQEWDSKTLYYWRDD